MPIVEAKVIPVAEPQRGDVVVFRYPVNPSQDFIKRVVGVGGDVVTYQDKKLTVNGQPLPQVRDGTYSYLENLRFETLEKWMRDRQQRQRTSRVHDRRSIRRRRPSIRKTCARFRAARIATTMTVDSRARCRPANIS